MIARDRELLTRASQVNRNLGIVVMEAIARQDSGELPAGPLREIGEALRRLADDIIARADEIEKHPTIEEAPC